MVNNVDTSVRSNMSVYETLMFAIAFAALVISILKFNQKK